MVVFGLGSYSILNYSTVKLLSQQKPQEQLERVKIRQSLPLPFTPEVIETTEEQEQAEIRKSAMSLVGTKDFDALDALARKHRDSKEQSSDGVWKLNAVYEGLRIDKHESSETQWKEHLAVLRGWVKAKPDSATARIALAESLISYAWRARGGGYASTVSKEGWKLFGERLRQATDVLGDARSLKEQCPRWWSMMQQAALGLGADRTAYDRIFNEAIARDPNYQAYYVRKVNYLLPRWHGKPGEWEAFLAKAADNVGGEDGDVLYARVVWFSESTFDNIFQECRVSWARVNKGFEAMLKRSPDSLGTKSKAAYLAGLASDRVSAKKYFEMMAGKVDLSVWNTKEKFIEHAQYAYNGVCK